jgi:hypothetical protein
MSDALLQHDVERILRDVLSTYGAGFSVLSVTPASTGWHITIMDAANRILSTDVADSRPAVVRAALTTWVLSQH